MPRTKVPRNYFTFAGGKVSDSNPLNPVPDSARTLMNVDLERNGKISRRLGLDLEDSYVTDLGPYSLSTLQNLSVNMFEWFNVDNSDNATFLVVRVGNTLHFYNEGTTPLSSGKIGELDIGVFADDTSAASKEGLSAASGKGVLFCVGARYNPFYVDYDPVANSFAGIEIELEKRDFEGSINDTLATDARPSSLTDGHEYNLLNQGWTSSKLSSFKSWQGVYPSNADIMHLGFYTNVESGLKSWSASEVVNSQLGNSQAAKGHFILGAFTENRASVSGVPGAQTGGTSFRPEAVAFFAGRVWYASVKGDIYFSQILTSLDNAGKCYQDQDPTAEDFNELLDTDGGVIRLPEAGTVKALATTGQGLAVMSNTGVWLISGGDSGFTANSSLVENISKVGIVGPNSVVKAEGTVFFWSEEGIYALVPDKISGKLNAQSLTDNRIQNDYREIVVAGKRLAQGTYDRTLKRIFWSYHDGQEGGATSLDPKFNSVIVYDIPTNAFWDYRIEDFPGTYTSPFMGGMVKRSAVSDDTSVTRITVNGEPVITEGGTYSIVSTSSTLEIGDTPMKVLCFIPDENEDFEVSFGEFTSRTFTDWFLVDNAGVNYKSVVETLPEVLGEGSVDKQATYLFTFFDYKRGGYGELLFSSRFEPKTGFRASQNVVEILRAGSPKLRSSQNVVELLRSGDPKMRTSQTVVEILREN